MMVAQSPHDALMNLSTVLLAENRALKKQISEMQKAKPFTECQRLRERMNENLETFAMRYEETPPHRIESLRKAFQGGPVKQK